MRSMLKLAGTVSVAGLALTGALCASPVSAQAERADAAAGARSEPAEAQSVLGEIVVTANRRAEPLQKVGIAVNAFSGTQLEALGVKSSIDLAKFVPAVSATGAQGGFLQTISIRGVTQNDFTPHQEAPVAAYTDDVYISSVQGQSFATFDIERVELLKGPQGTLFGRNATGGLVNYITKKPTDTFNGYVDAKYGSYNLRAFEAAIGGPISGDKVMFRLAGTYSAHDPILKNLIGPDGYREMSYAGRGELLVRPSDDFEMMVTARYGRSTISNDGANQYPATIAILDANGDQIDGRFLGRNETAQVITPAGPVGTRPCAGCDFFGYRDPDGLGHLTADPYVGNPVSYNTSKRENESYSTTYGITDRITATTGDITLVNIMDYTHFKWRFGGAFTGGSFKFGFDTFANGIDQISDEFRISGNHGAFRWTTGLYYLNIDSNDGEAFGFLPGGLTGDGSVPGDEVILFRQRTSSISAFAQAEYDITPKLTAIAGGRFIRDQKTFDYSADLVTAAGVEFFNIAAFNPSTSSFAHLRNNLYAFKFGLNWKPTSDLLIYGTVNRGVKGGGYNALTAPAGVAFSQYIFKPERLMSYEGGFKSSFDGHKYTLNGSIFYYDYKNYQGYKEIGLTSLIANSNARTYGGELEFRANPVRHLDLQVGAAYTNALVKDVQLAPGYVVNRRPGFSPKVQLNGLVRYEIPSPIGTFALQADASYRTSYYLQLVNYQDERNAAFALVNLRASLSGNNKAGWEVYADVQNLTNKRYLVSAFDVSTNFGDGIDAWNKPRTFDVGLHYSF